MAYDRPIPFMAIHVGEYLKELLEVRGMTQSELSELSGVSRSRIRNILKCKLGITPRQSAVFGKILCVADDYFTRFQMRYDVDKRAIRITPEEFQADEKRVEEGEERRVFAMIAMQIRRELRKQGITHAEFAKRLGVDPSIVTRYLSGKHNFQLRTLVKVQQILGIDIINNWYFPEN